MNYSIRTVLDEDKDAILSIYNYYVENGFAVYREDQQGNEFFQGFKEIAKGYPFYVFVIPDNKVIGFAFLHSDRKEHSFNRVAGITYFISPDYTRKGIGRNLLETLINEARKTGIETLLASISSKNRRSLNFHKKNGFRECGKFLRIGKKFGKDFDVVWMQRFI